MTWPMISQSVAANLFASSAAACNHKPHSATQPATSLTACNHLTHCCCSTSLVGGWTGGGQGVDRGWRWIRGEVEMGTLEGAQGLDRGLERRSRWAQTSLEGSLSRAGTIWFKSSHTSTLGALTAAAAKANCNLIASTASAGFDAAAE